jgi:hypothetical protein
MLARDVGKSNIVCSVYHLSGTAPRTMNRFTSATSNETLTTQ